MTRRSFLSKENCGGLDGSVSRRGDEGRMSVSARWVVRVAQVGVAAFLASIELTACVGVHPHRSSSPPLPLQLVGEVALPGDNSRFDYASLDSGRGLLFIAHLGAGEVIEVDLRANAVLRTIGDLAQVHGVLVVPELHRVFATATGDNRMASIDEDTGVVLYRTPTGEYPDGLAYDPKRSAIWTTNETGGSETVIGAADGAVRGTVDVGGRRATSPTTRPPTRCWSPCRAVATSPSSTPPR